MRWDGLLAACTIGLLAATVGATEPDALPAPWFRTGSANPPDRCRVSVAPAKGFAFDNLVIRCDGLTGGFATVMQQVAADDYRGKRLRFSAQVRGDAIQGWAGLWMRVDGENGKVLAFDNMRTRPLKGTFEWLPASVVLDVASDAKVIAFGMLENGDGAMFTGGMSIDVVGNDVRSTADGEPLPKAPRNLSLGR